MDRQQGAPSGIAVTLMGMGSLWYLLCEAISAYAFPDYSYAYNWISDLGVTTPGTYQGRIIDSQLAGVMNAGFVITGLLTAIAGVIIFWTTGQRRRLAVLLLAVFHGAGIAIVGLVYGSQENQDAGFAVFHFGGAMIAIICGNVLVMVLATSTLRDQLPTWTRRAAVIFGALGVLGLEVGDSRLMGGWPSQAVWGRASLE